MFSSFLGCTLSTNILKASLSAVRDRSKLEASCSETSRCGTIAARAAIVPQFPSGNCATVSAVACHNCCSHNNVATIAAAIVAPVHTLRRRELKSAYGCPRLCHNVATIAAAISPIHALRRRESNSLYACPRTDSLLFFCFVFPFCQFPAPLSSQSGTTQTAWVSASVWEHNASSGYCFAYFSLVVCFCLHSGRLSLSASATLLLPFIVECGCHHLATTIIIIIIILLFFHCTDTADSGTLTSICRKRNSLVSSALEA